MTVRIFEGLLEKDSKNRESLLCGIGRIYVQVRMWVKCKLYIFIHTNPFAYKRIMSVSICDNFISILCAL